MFIDSLDVFLKLNENEVEALEHLYLPNSDLASWFALEDNLLAFLDQLVRAKNLSKINLRNNGLAHIQLLRIGQALRQSGRLTYINLLQNASLKLGNLSSFPRIENFLAEDLPTNLPRLELPTGWRLEHHYFLIEIAEMFLIARMIYAVNPELKKLHAYDRPISHKRNQELKHPEHIQTNMPLPIIVIDPQKFAIVPHYSANSMPNKIQELVAAQRHNDSVTERYKLVLAYKEGKIGWAWAKIRIDKDSAPNPQEQLARLKTNQLAVNVTRPYKTKPAVMLLETMHLYKTYCIGKFFGIYDMWEAVINQQDITTTHKITAVIAMLLEAACYHAAGLLHADMKPENFVWRNENEAKLIDFENATLMRDKQKINRAASHTSRHIPPEAINLTVDTYTKDFDYYSFGYSLLRIFVPCLDSDKRPSLNEALTEVEQNYGYAIAVIVAELLHPDPTQRLSIQAAIVKFFALYPAIFEQCINATLQREKNELIKLCDAYPQAQIILASINSEILSAYVPRQIINAEQLNTVLNDIFKLQTLLFYLQVFKFTATIPAELTSGIQLLFAQPTKPIQECTEQYFYFPALEDQIIALHNASQTEQALVTQPQNVCALG